MNFLKAYYNKKLLEAGCDEAGRGCLAGPVFAAAVILPVRNGRLPKALLNLNDSKKLNELQRNKLRLEIEKYALHFSVAKIDNKEIDKINILNASIKAMHSAISKLKIKPEFLLIDGNRFKPYDDVPFKCIVKGDSKYASIAAASILAKTYRDEYMKNLHKKYPYYLWHKNKGYPSKEHKKAILKYGISPFHRLSFKLYDKQLQINFV